MALYIYCIAEGRPGACPGAIGVENRKIYAAPYRDIMAIVHDGLSPLPTDRDVLKNWLVVHHMVVERAFMTFNGVMPFSFGNMMERDKLMHWLKKDYRLFKRKFRHLNGRSEYAVQVFWDSESVSDDVAKTPQIRKVKKSIDGLSEGIAYLEREKLKKMIGAEMSTLAEKHFKNIHGRLKELAEEVCVDAVKGEICGKQMIANFSCLLKPRRVSELKSYLAALKGKHGIVTRLTGPWPPYSFSRLRS